ncbi:solute carrier family 25 member 45 isoform X2 [Dendroctonus ponderosae]|uniref:solute carrier family 25 member 45 isoform X2 n=1 Tax=Dendroctonus ponderosae TaxID=77166 RepID=UPI002035EC5D|nr:solute carrier family 25 member 45 isoform X2 [Dendroctonus ponderosae]
MSSPLIAYGPSNSLFFGGTGLFMKLLSGADQADLNYNQQRTKFLWNIFVSGCFGGFLQVTLMCPVELVKIALQTSTEDKSPWVHNANALKFEGSIHTFKTIFALKGLRGLYKGFVPMLIRDVPTGGIYFVVYEGLLPKNREDVQWYHKIWAGGWAVLPVDVVKTRMQADDLLYPNYHNMTDCIQKLYREEGIKFFWKGLPVITARAFPAHAMLFIGYDMTMIFLGSRR